VDGSRPIDDGYAIVVRLDGRPVLVVGGGQIALRKTDGLLVSGATVTVVSPMFVEGFGALSSTGAVTLVERRYESSDLDGHWLVVAATNDAAVQQQIFDEGEARRMFVNCVDDPDRCSFILPAIERRGPVIVAVSTQGRSPSLAGYLRNRLRDALPDNIEELANDLAEQRRRVQAAGGSTEDVSWPNPL
jgi:precorrin-2 dehydrogenase / sirohydrochlorin ferrochelatase